MPRSLMFGATSVLAQGRPTSPDSEAKTESSMQAGSTRPSTANLTCEPTTWGGRLAYVLEDDVIRLVALSE